MSIKQIIQRIKSFFSPIPVGTKLEGKVKFFDRKKRFAFIVSGSNEYFFHAAATRPRDFKALQEGVAVKFELIQGKKGPQASKVELI